ncbi:MAG: hypothetical protein PF541_06190 [Prolixibacteraceae bacterium]|nr:hypothetical protein [Prolixibacteraceae bacterium]
MMDNQADIGNIRETFFYNQVSQVYEVMASPYSDFLVNGKFTFEVGGKSKKKKQISNIENSFVLKDDIETGYENVVPLWLFGFLY